MNSGMKIHWNDKDPIYRQLHDKLVELILEGSLPEGTALPSIREISSEHRINHITVGKAIQMLVDEGLVEKRRGVGMYVAQGAPAALSDTEKQKFLHQEWPLICKKIWRLGLSPEALLKGIKEGKKS
jgi:GntR family transcriptional regulator